MYGWTTNKLNIISKNSANGNIMYAANWSNNLSIYSSLTVIEISQSNYETRDSKANLSRHSLAIVMSDGDNLQWVATDFIEHDEFLLLNQSKKNDVKAVFLPVHRLILFANKF